METQEKIVEDQLGRKVKFRFPPQRIVSLVPSQTELLYYLGLGDKVVGRTKFCIHPATEVHAARIVGGTKKVRMDEIRTLQPDLIIGNKEENKQDQIAQLASQYPVWLSDIRTLGDAYRMIAAIGDICGVADASKNLVRKLKTGFDACQFQYSGSVAYVIWMEPLMVVGSDTFIDQMLTHLGFTNAITSTRYPEISLDELHALAPDFVFLSSEPFPFSAKHLEFFAAELPRTTIMLVDGEAFSWYGSRLLHSLAYFDQLL